jgi:hypothetical protein
MGRRLPDGAAGIGAEGAGAWLAATQAAEPPEDPPGTQVQIPGVAHRAEGAVFIGTSHGEFIHVEFADDHRILFLEFGTAVPS